MVLSETYVYQLADISPEASAPVVLFLHLWSLEMSIEAAESTRSASKEVIPSLIVFMSSNFRCRQLNSTQWLLWTMRDLEHLEN